MKTIASIMVLLSIISMGELRAQTSRGTFLLSVASISSLNENYNSRVFADCGLTTQKYKSKGEADSGLDPVKVFGVNLHPQVGYFFFDNLALGLEAETRYSRVKDKEGDSRSNELMILTGPFARYYIPFNHFLLFVEGNGSLGQMDSEYIITEEEKSETYFKLVSYGGSIGTAIPLGDKLTFDIQAVYRSMNRKYVPEETDTGFDTGYSTIHQSTGVRLGFTILL